MSSRKPVTRLRQVVEPKQIKTRDPRFSELTGSLSVDRFRSRYDFLPEMHKNELQELKINLARAQKLLTSSPQHLREEREHEVQRLERAMKRMESIVNREKRDNAEQDALIKIQAEEKQKRKAGKKGWWLKESEKKDIKARARLDVIAKEGGKKAVKKAIEKKQRKIGQKEKKARPFPKSASGWSGGGQARLEGHGDSVNSRKRMREEDSSQHTSKRPRVDR